MLTLKKHWNNSRAFLLQRDDERDMLVVTSQSVIALSAAQGFLSITGMLVGLLVQAGELALRPLAPAKPWATGLFRAPHSLLLTGFSDHVNNSRAS